MSVLIWLIACLPPLTAPLTADNPYNDFDGDGYTETDEPGDCNDTDASVSPETIWYPDVDGDGYGDAAGATASCLPPGDAYIRGNATDCDDSRQDINPGATEGCTTDDLNCDGVAGTDDGDGDGYTGCEDCNDADASIHPGADEVCDHVDNDCDGAVDENPIDPSTWYLDNDQDGYGDPAVSTTACDQPANHVANGNDCLDADANAHPGGTEICNHIDDDCDGTIDDNATDAKSYYADADGDGFGTGTAVVTCVQPANTVTNHDDCNDGNGAIHPGVVEVCDGADQDCDGIIDDNATDARTWHQDADNDGYGAPAVTTKACSQPAGYVIDGTDCDDTKSNVHPGAAEIDPLVDENCNGNVLL